MCFDGKDYLMLHQLTPGRRRSSYHDMTWFDLDYQQDHEDSSQDDLNRDEDRLESREFQAEKKVI